MKKTRKEKPSTELVEKMKTIQFISDKFPAAIVGTRCPQSGIRIPESKSEYRRKIESLGFHQESPSVLKKHTSI